MGKIIKIVVSILAVSSFASVARSEMLDIEKDELKFGFIKLTDCAPIVIAKEKGYFEDEGLQVEVIAQPNWKQLLDNVINGELDGAHMLSGQPIAATIGFGTKAHIVTSYTMDLNGNGITVSNDIWKGMQENDPDLDSDTPRHPITADALKPIVYAAKDEGKLLPMGMVFPVSTHNYEIRYWLAAAGIHPGMYTSTDIKGFTDGDIELSTTPPPQMPATLESGKNVAYCVGEPRGISKQSLRVLEFRLRLTTISGKITRKKFLCYKKVVRENQYTHRCYESSAPVSGSMLPIKTEN